MAKKTRKIRPSTRKSNLSGENEKAEGQSDIIKEAGSKKTFFYIIGALALILLIIFGSNVFFTKVAPINNPYNYEYNDIEFVKLGDYWYTDIHLSSVDDMLFNLEMRYDPRSVEDIPVDKSVRDQFYRSKGFYLTAAPNLTGKTAVSMLQVNRIVGKDYNMLNFPTEGAVTFVIEGYEDNKIIDCENATAMIKVIWFGIGEETKITCQDNCIKIYGTNQTEIMRSADRFIYDILGIM